jgi:hypothetical protein
VKYEVVAQAYRDLEQASGRLMLIDRLAALLAGTPQELLPTVCYLCQGLVAPLTRAQRPARVDSRVPADVWFEPSLVLEVLTAELTLSPNHTAGWGQLKDDAGLSMRFPRFTGRWRDDKEPQDATTTRQLVELYRTARRTPTG